MPQTTATHRKLQNQTEIKAAFASLQTTSERKRTDLARMTSHLQSGRVQSPRTSVFPSHLRLSRSLQPKEKRQATSSQRLRFKDSNYQPIRPNPSYVN
ncbi:hypothetical protein ACLB2K_003766 [Fragaria x ananassa]